VKLWQFSFLVKAHSFPQNNGLMDLSCRYHCLSARPLLSRKLDTNEAAVRLATS
jgi:hypothetical protein